MFPFVSFGSCGRGFSYGFETETPTRKSRLQYKLQWLKRTRDELESKLAAVSASIATVEKQLAEEETAV